MTRTFFSPTLDRLRPLFSSYGALLAFSLFTPILYFGGPVFMFQVGTRVLTGRSEATLWALAAIATFMMMVLTALEWVRKTALDRIGIAINERLGRVVFDAVHRPAASSGSAPTVLADFNTVRDFLSGPSISALFDLLFVPVHIALLWFVHWVFAVVAVVMIIVTGGLTLLNHYLVRSDSRRYQSLSTTAQDFGVTVSRNADSIRALGMLPALRDRWYGLNLKTLGWRAAATRRTDVLASLVRFVRVMQMVVVYTVGAMLFLRNELAAGALMVALMVMMRGLGPADSVISNWRAYAGFLAALERLDALLRDGQSRTVMMDIPDLVGPLVLARVSAGPPRGGPVLNDISFRLAPGRTLGVVGPSGAGKSCLGRVLVGVWPVSSGSIAVGDHELMHWNEDDRGRRLGYMAQDVELLPGTIAENIARFDPPSPERTRAVLAAAELAGIQDLVRALPDGYGTTVGPGRHVLSGGQRSRIALARAVYGDPKLVVLDEPNSNLDAVGEQALVTMIQALKARRCVVVVITHKVNLLGCCDDVLVLNAGTVQAFGARDQIVNSIPRAQAMPHLTVIEGAADGRRS